MSNKTTKVTLIHEQLAKKYGIPTQEEIFDGEGLKPIPKNWLWEMVENSIDRTEKNIPYHFTRNKKDRVIILGFDEEDMAEKFLKEFRSIFFTEMKDYIIKKDKDPQSYNRAAVMTIEPQGKQLKMRIS